MFESDSSRLYRAQSLVGETQPTWNAGEVHVPTVVPVGDSAVTVTFHTPRRACATFARNTPATPGTLTVRVTVPPFTRVNATV